MESWRNELVAALVVLVATLVAAVRARVKKGKSIMPRARVSFRTHFSIRTPESEPSAPALSDAPPSDAPQPTSEPPIDPFEPLELGEPRRRLDEPRVSSRERESRDRITPRLPPPPPAPSDRHGRRKK